MPEGLEAEIWRRSSAPLIGRTITKLWVDDRVAPVDTSDIMLGATIRGIDRLGKALVVRTDGPSGNVRLGLHFGMTGRLVVDGSAPIARLEYASGADRPEWDRLRLWTAPSAAEAPALRLNDPRRLGRISIDPDLSHLGPDALSLQTADLGRQISGRRIAIKSALLDQSIVAGIGNLCGDEVLFDAGIAPTRPCETLSRSEVAAIARSCRRRLKAMLQRGGSTMGHLDPSIRSGPGDCPADGTRLRRSTIGGRTAVWCPVHQV